jgi:putative PIN family toxin of toxin-antitoxin system
MNVVIDTNVIVSATLRAGSVPWQALETAMRHGRLLVSNRTLDELHFVLRRPRFDKLVSLERRMDIFAEVLLLGEDVTITQTVTACRDPRDDKFLEVAVNGNATHIVSGDLDLLALHPFRGIPILTPADFLTAVGAHP